MSIPLLVPNSVCASVFNGASYGLARLSGLLQCNGKKLEQQAERRPLTLQVLHQPVFLMNLPNKTPLTADGETNDDSKIRTYQLLHIVASCNCVAARDTGS